MLKKVIWLVIIILAIWLAVSLLGSDNKASAPTGEEANPTSAVPVPGSDVPEMVVGSGVGVAVTYTDSGFSPQTVGPIEKGDAVLFKNESSREFWPASALHPSHEVYPGSSRSKCGTPEEEGVFDACRGIPSGGEWTFTFNEVGSWKYHDHLNASRIGTVVVE